MESMDSLGYLRASLFGYSSFAWLVVVGVVVDYGNGSQMDYFAA